MNPDELRLPANPNAAEPEQPASPPERPHSGVFLGKFRGIRFYLDYSWFLIFAIVTYALSSNSFPEYLRGRPAGVYLAMGVAAALLFFFSIILHELGHSIVSQRCGIPVPSITLLFIGGIAEISREPDNARSELKIALAGPGVSLILVALYTGLAWFCGLLHLWEAQLVFAWLATMNLWLVIFNAIPGYPLDGGRVLRALLWMRDGKLRRATYITSRIGVALSWFLMALGVVVVFAGAWNGLVFILVGVFLKNAAESGYSQTIFKEVLNGVRVRDLMTRHPITIPAELPLNLAVDDYFLTNHHVAFPVVDDETRYRGLLRLEFLKSVPRERWPYTTAGQVADMHAGGSFNLPAETLASNAFRELLVAGQGRLGVTDSEGRLIGIITRHDLLHFIRIHTELEA
jgi:Zn-dependent protease